MTKIALITGANKDLGLETARQLAQQGIHVIIVARDATKGQAAAQNLQAVGYSADFIALDVSNEASVKQAAQIVIDRYGKLDILVNNAGINPDLQELGELCSVPKAFWSKLLSAAENMNLTDHADFIRKKL